MSFVKMFEDFSNNTNQLNERFGVKGYDPEKYVYFKILNVDLNNYFDDEWYETKYVEFSFPDKDNEKKPYNRMAKEDVKKFIDSAKKKGLKTENESGKFPVINFFEQKNKL